MQKQQHLLQGKSPLLLLVGGMADLIKREWDMLIDEASLQGAWHPLTRLLEGSSPETVHEWVAKAVQHCLLQRAEFEWHILSFTAQVPAPDCFACVDPMALTVQHVVKWPLTC